MGPARRLRPSLIAALAFLLPAGVEAADSPPGAYEPTEIEVKAAFLFHFAQLVTWPDPSSEPSSPFVIAIVGSDPFGKRLEATIGSEEVRGRPIRVERVARTAGLRSTPAIAYVGVADPSDLRRELASLSRSHVLTVGSSQGFARRGGMIEFRLTSDSRVAFDINVQAVEAAGLRMSSQLLKIARIVEADR